MSVPSGILVPMSETSAPTNFAQLVKLYTERAGYPASLIEAEERGKVEGWARGAQRRNGRHVIYYDQRVSKAPVETQRFLAAHEIARLVHDAPRLPAIKMWSAIAEIGAVLLAISLITLLLAGFELLTTAIGLVGLLVASAVLLSWVATARRIESKADRYAVEVLDAPIEKAWSHPFMLEGTDTRPWWASPSIPWHYRYFSTLAAPLDQASPGQVPTSPPADGGDLIG